MHSARYIVAVLPILLTTHCGGDDTTIAPAGSPNGTDSGVDAGKDVELDAAPEALPDAPAPAPITWTACPLHHGESGDSAQCAQVDLPLRWDEPDGPMISVFVQRLLGSQQPSNKQIWLLQGGPGAASDGWATFMESTAALDPTIDFYTLDHRGVGRSTRLGCPDAESPGSLYGTAISDPEWPACIQSITTEWGDDLAEFSSEAAARDVAALLERTREADKRVFLYGASYGTTWGHRFLQLFPDAADGVILDSMNWPDRTYDDYDLIWNEVGRRLFEACGQQATCGSKLGSDPWATLTALHADLSSGHCPTLGLTSPTLKAMLAWFIAYDITRVFAPVLVYRLARCTPEDQTAIVHLYEAAFGDGGLFDLAGNELFSQVLSQNILMSELTVTTASSPTLEKLEQIVADSQIGLGAAPSARKRGPQWPRYPFRDELRQWAETKTPLLMLNGGLDPFAPVFRLEQAGAHEHFTAPHQHFITFPVAAHGVVSGTPTIAGQQPCGLQLFLQFVANPKAELDESCRSMLAPLNLTSSPYTSVLMGTDDLWENDAP